MKEKKSFFGSKYMKTPDQITLDTFSPSEFFEPAIKQPDLVDGDFMHKEDNIKIELYLFIRKKLIDFLFQPIKNVFSKYINEEYSFGEEDTLNDDVKKYASTKHDDLPDTIKEDLATLDSIPDHGNATFPGNGDIKGSGDSSTNYSFQLYKHYKNKVKRDKNSKDDRC